MDSKSWKGSGPSLESRAAFPSESCQAASNSASVGYSSANPFLLEHLPDEVTDLCPGINETSDPVSSTSSSLIV